MSDTPKICLIAALSENFAIGKAGKLLWHLPDDMKWFRQKTREHAVIMGRKTLEAMPNGQPLPKRLNIVVSRHPQTSDNDMLRWTDNLPDAVKIGTTFAHEQNQNEVFIIGGGEIYKETIEQADRLYLTMVDAKAEGDAFFPEFDKSQWSKILVMQVDKTETVPGYNIYQYDRI